MSIDPPDEPELGPAAGGSEPTEPGRPSVGGAGRHAAPAGAPSGTATGEQPTATGRARHRMVAPRSRRRTALIGLIGAFVVVLGLLIGAVTFETTHLDSNVSRLDNALPAQDRPAESAAESQTFLVAGVEPVAGADRPLLDTVLLMHVPSDRTAAQVVAVPVDTWVAGIGATPAGGFRAGGAAQLVSTVEALSDVRVDHYAQVDFQGFAQIVDDLAGIDLDVPQPYANRGYDFPAGRQHLDGAAALAYIRDADAAARSTTALREQAVIAAVFDRASQLGALSDLGTLTGVLSTLTSAFSVDETISDTDLVSLVWGMRGVGRPAFVTTPTSGTGQEAGRPVVYLDDARAAALWGYLSADTLAAHLDDFR